MLRYWFKHQLSDHKIECALRRLSPDTALTDKKSATTQSHVTVSCVQRQIQQARDVKSYITMLNKFTVEAVSQGAHLVVFPEFNFLDLLGLIPGFSFINGRVSSSSPNGSVRSTTGRDPIADVFSAIADSVERTMTLTCSYLAELYHIYIYSGSYITKRRSVLYNAGSLYGPDGNLVGEQQKLHLTPLEAKMGLGRGRCLKVYELPIGNIALPICMDATYYETFSIARNLGADMVIMPIANPEEYNMWRALRGVWGRVQEAQVFGLKASLNGYLAGMHYTGKAGVFAPLEMTKDKNGVVAIADHYEGDQLVTATLDLRHLAQVRQRSEYRCDTNSEFEASFSRYYNMKHGGEKSEQIR